MHSILLLSLVLVATGQASALCKHSYQTVCDSISDYEKYNDGTWTDVVIKSKTISKREPFRVVKFRTLSSLTLIGQVDGLGDSEGTCPYDIDLKILNLYDNSIEAINPGNFLRFLKLKKLGLVNNGIKVVHKEAFSLPQIEVIDLSENEIEKVENGSFTNEASSSRVKTRMIFITKNRVKSVDPKSFPPSLQVLRLDHNELTGLDDEVFTDLPYLQSLHLSNNQLNDFPNVDGLYNLRILDLGFNNIQVVDSEALKNSRNLQVLDLTRNKITRVGFLKVALSRHSPLEVSLAFNNIQNLKDLDINETLTEKVVNLYGNPWLCDDWSSIETSLQKMNLKRSQCDTEAFDNEDISFCQLSYSRALDEHVEELYEKMMKRGHLLKCSFMQKTYGNVLYKESADIRCIGG